MSLDITTDPAAVAIMDHGNAPTLDDFFTATWTSTAPTGSNASMELLSKEYRYIQITASVNGETDTAWLQILIGAGGDFTPATAGLYDVHVKITDNPEVPVLRAGTLYFRD